MLIFNLSQNGTGLPENGTKENTKKKNMDIFNYLRRI